MAASKPLQRTEYQWFESQKNRATQAYDLGWQQNKYERDRADVQARWSRDDLTNRYQQQRDTFHNSFNRRGMLNSGNWQSSLGRLQADRDRAYGRLTTGDQWRNAGYDLAGNQLATVRDDALKELRDQQQAYEEQLATMITGYRP